MSASPAPPIPDNPTLAHRKEIDGLRSIAVLAVVLYHFGVPGLSGGFVGVDVFFVISGFLIGAILLKELGETGRISLARFYSRRFRRLAPAFFAMVAVTALVAYFIVLPFELREFGKTVIASTVYLSNVYFYGQSGYFDSASEEKFLLHTWSLSVEEQFYVFLPLCLLLFCRRTRWVLPVLCIFFAASLAANLIFTPLSHSAAFFLFPFRAWEMLAGVLLAAWGLHKGETWAHGAWASWAGLVLVVGGILLIKPGEAFPGFQVIAPVAGTALLIWNGKGNNPVNRLLSMRGPVFIGLLSYSLYLWHWPILTLSLYWSVEYSGPMEMITWLAFTGIVSWASWRFIEAPVRQLPLKRYSVIFGAAATGSITALAIGAVFYKGEGLPERFSPAVQTHIRASQDFLQDWSRCTVPANGPFEGIEICPVGPEGTPTFLAWGDSHLRALKEGLDLAAHEAERPGLIIWKAGCPPFFDIEKEENTATRFENASCRIQNDQIRRALASEDNLTDVLLVGRWSYYAEGTGTGDGVEERIALSGADGSALEGNDTPYLAGLRHTLIEMVGMGKGVFLLRQPPEIPHYSSVRVARATAHRRIDAGETDMIINVPRSSVEARVATSEAPFDTLSSDGLATILDSWPWFCGDAACSAVVGDQAVYFDNNHITNTGAIHLRGVLAPLFERD
ncbi:acyltransferase family protein [Algicella marina]|uniref:Acyltransferase family protein n=1 Tax=Algicella marina TaxID=2683284 RepID=A0A6P1SXK7_9RHOB|nr:acyltransferase family protein [Algicella marina]QHQ34285.1 acyltransferase family protein [Algicella marina]